MSFSDDPREEYHGPGLGPWLMFVAGVCVGFVLAITWVING